jgi:hypothetical protein
MDRTTASMSRTGLLIVTVGVVSLQIGWVEWQRQAFAPTYQKLGLVLEAQRALAAGNWETGAPSPLVNSKTSSLSIQPLTPMLSVLPALLILRHSQRSRWRARGCLGRPVRPLQISILADSL